MTKVHRLPDPEVTERTASEWIARLAGDDVSVEDRERCARWQAAHPQHARTYAAMRRVWQDCEAAGPLVRAVGFGQSMNESMNQSMNEARLSRASLAQSRWRLRSLATAATVAVALLGGGWLWVTRPISETFETAVGERASVHLPDGSSLELNSNSRVAVRYAAHAREVRLERGESYFNVLHDPARPFQVLTQGAVIRDVGTAFNVDLRPTGLQVTVDEGEIDVRSGRGWDAGSGIGSAMTVAKGEQATVAGPSVAVRTLSADEFARSSAWRTGTLAFEQTPLSEVVAEMSRYTTTTMVVADPVVGQMPIGGNFPANAAGAETLIQLLKDGLNVPIRQVDQTIYIGEAKARKP